MRVGYRKSCEVTVTHRSEREKKTRKFLAKSIECFSESVRLAFRYSCIQQLAGKMGATGIGRAVSSEAETLGSEKKMRFGQFKAGPYQRLLCPG